MVTAISNSTSKKKTKQKKKRESEKKERKVDDGLDDWLNAHDALTGKRSHPIIGRE